jgi:hypothetical protein
MPAIRGLAFSAIQARQRMRPMVMTVLRMIRFMALKSVCPDQGILSSRGNKLVFRQGTFVMDIQHLLVEQTSTTIPSTWTELTT